MNPATPVTDPHARAAELIPWSVNGTLAPEEESELQAHLSGCERCRRDRDSQSRLYEAMRAGDSLVFAAEPSFQKLMARIGAEEELAREGVQALPPAAPGAPAPGMRSAALAAAPRQPGRRQQRRGRLWVRSLAAAVVIETLGLGLGAWSWHSGRAAPTYVTLTSPDSAAGAGPRVRVVFRNGLQMQELESILRGTGTRIIAGPDGPGVYTLSFTGDAAPDSIDRRIAALRSRSGVVFAEPVNGDGGAR